jgi:4-hydroxy-2-oxoglutarate aldolase
VSSRYLTLFATKAGPQRRARACSKRNNRFVSSLPKISIIYFHPGEPSHLSRAERLAVIKTHRAAMDSAGFPNMPLIAGTGVSSTWETIELTKEAVEAGANFVMVIPPGYFKSSMTDESLENFFTEVSPPPLPGNTNLNERQVASSSPVGVLLYNFPGAGAGKSIARTCKPVN